MDCCFTINIHCCHTIFCGNKWASLKISEHEEMNLRGNYLLRHRHSTMREMLARPFVMVYDDSELHELFGHVGDWLIGLNQCRHWEIVLIGQYHHNRDVWRLNQGSKTKRIVNSSVFLRVSNQLCHRLIFVFLENNWIFNEP